MEMVMSYQNKKYDPHSIESRAVVWLIGGVVFPIAFLVLYGLDVVGSRYDDLSPSNQSVREWIFNNMRNNQR